MMKQNLCILFKEQPWWFSGKESTCNTGDAGSIPGSGRYPGGGIILTFVFLHGESLEQRSLGDCSPWGHKEWDRAEVT